MSKAKGGARKGAGRKPYEPTEGDRKKVLSMAGFGLPQDQIALVIGISQPTLRKYFEVELDTGAIQANAKVAESLFVQAVGAPAVYDAKGKLLRAEQPRIVTAGIFWAKTRMHWKETTAHEHSGPDGAPLPSATPPSLLIMPVKPSDGTAQG